MPSATASGADATPNGNAKSRDHNQGNQDRKYTPEQKVAVIRVRKCASTAFYEILGIEKTVSDGEIKKAYRKLSLLTHPDKNGYDGADEAFKSMWLPITVRRSTATETNDMASIQWYRGLFRSYQILKRKPNSTDSEETRITDLDPALHQPRLPLVGLHGHKAVEEAQCTRMRFHQKSSSIGSLAEEWAVGGLHLLVSLPGLSETQRETNPRSGGNVFDGGPQFVFNMGGGPGFRVHQFGGNRPRRRPREANENSDETPQSTTSILTNLLPLLILFVLPLLSSIFSSSSSEPPGPMFRFDGPSPPYTVERTTPRLKVNYYVNPNDILDLSNRKLNQLHERAEATYVSQLQYECEVETQGRNRMMQEAQGWFFPDVDRMHQARNMELRSCRRLDELRLR